MCERCEHKKAVVILIHLLCEKCFRIRLRMMSPQMQKVVGNGVRRIYNEDNRNAVIRNT